MKQTAGFTVEAHIECWTNEVPIEGKLTAGVEERTFGLELVVNKRKEQGLDSKQGLID